MVFIGKGQSLICWCTFGFCYVVQMYMYISIRTCTVGLEVVALSHSPHSHQESH